MAVEKGELQRRVQIERLFLKDLSFTSPRAPQSVTTGASVEKLLNIRSNNTHFPDDQFEVTLTLGVKGIAGGETVFQVEVLQAGLFTIRGYSAVEHVEILGRVCPEILFPFACRTVAETALKGGFPNVIVNPLNFDALLAENMRDRAHQTAKN